MNIILILLGALNTFAASYQSSRVDYSYSPNDYLFKDRMKKYDPVFDDFRRIELGIDLGSGVDCGRLDVQGTLKSTIGNILDSNYFGNAVNNIVAGAPLLTICYFSPTWCALAKHFRLNSQFMSELRLNQCALMDKYVDTRVEDYYAERQQCLHKKIQEFGGDHERAVSACGGSGLFDKDLSNWAGGQYGGKVKTNKLIESSAKWAGLTSPNAKRAVELVKAFVGDTTVSKGHITVEYGPRTVQLSPELHLRGLKEVATKKLCGELVPQVVHGGATYQTLGQVTDRDLKSITGGDDIYVDRQTILYLASMEPARRDLYCEKLAAAAAMSKFSKDVSQTHNILNQLSQNPNLPKNRKAEIIEKRNSFMKSVEITMQVQKEQANPINEVVAQINAEGKTQDVKNSNEVMRFESNRQAHERLHNSYFDCADGVFCEGTN